jgi:FkbH-like protein
MARSPVKKHAEPVAPKDAVKPEAVKAEAEKPEAAKQQAPVYQHEEVVRALFRSLLLRDPNDENFPKFLRQQWGKSIDQMVKELLSSQEFLNKHQVVLDRHLPGNAVRVPDLHYRSPTDLVVTPSKLRRVMIIGQCLLGQWPNELRQMMPGCACDFLLFNHVQALPAQPPAPVAEYDFQVVSVPLRSVIPETEYTKLSYSDAAAYQRLFQDSVERLRQTLDASMGWNRQHGLLTFVPSFVLPQQNPLGRVLPRYDLRNFVHFVEKLNEVLAAEVAKYGNTYFFDFDQVIASYGRRYYQDDAVWITNHNADLSDFDFEKDQSRIEKPARASQVYPEKRSLFVRLAWTELLAMYRTIRQTDMVKLVVVDLDDTLWRGVAAERTSHDPEAIEGWPIGLVEALSHLKRRGVLLAMLSKNEEKLIAPIWQRYYGRIFPLSEFAIRKINWRPKAENLEEILKETNLLPRSTVFIDDNPVERAAIKAAFPEVRSFGPNPLLWRRILLWSAETQVPSITAESAARTEMMQAQVERETQRKQLSREEFLASLNVEIELREVDGVEHADFPRTLELVNKSNQFNTTGERWTKQQFQAALAAGTRVFVFEVKDRFTSYGIVGVVICDKSSITQFVMSCRVVGMEVEIAVIGELLRVLRKSTGAQKFSAKLKETELNLLARDLWQKCGFSVRGGQWSRAYSPQLAVPKHIRMSTTLSDNAVGVAG